MTDQQPTALDELADVFQTFALDEQPARRRAAAILAQHARELAEQTHELARERNRAMTGNRSRVATCAGIHHARRQLTEYADRLDANEQQGAQQP